MSKEIFNIPTCIVRHFLIKDVNRYCFFYESSNYHKFMNSLRREINCHSCRLHAYALLSDQVHLLVSSPQYSYQTKMIDFLLTDYANYFNFTNRRVNRKIDLDYSYQNLEPEHQLLTYIQYIELSPVRLYLAEHPADYPWSSYGYNAMGEDTGLVSPHKMYLELGPDESSRRRRYRKMFHFVGQ